VIIPYQKEGYSEGLEEVAIFTENNAKSFSDNIQKLLKSANLREKYSEKSFAKAKEFDVEKIEQREAEIYSELIGVKNN
jgi:glycosyltransferase involved in cell wall biosynthesis